MKILRLSMLLLSGFGILLGVQSCKTVKDISTVQLEGKWVLKTFDGKDVKESFEGKIPTIEFNLAENRIFGTGGCNNYTGGFTLNKNEFSAPSLASTMMMCMDANRESEFLQALGQKSQIAVLPAKKSGESNMLVFSQGKKQVLVFEKAKPISAESLSGEWTLQSIQGSSANILFDENPPTIRFDASENRVNGNAGCNRYNGSFTLEGDKLGVTNVATTRMACSRMEGESKFISLLTSGLADIELEANMLVLRKDGVELLRFTK